MWINPLLLGVGVAVTIIAIVVAALATVRARAAQARLRAIEAESGTAVEGQGRPEQSGVDVAAVAGTGTLDPAPAGDEPPKVRLLVVEDEPGIRDFITRALIRRGLEVVAVVGPVAALTALTNRPEIRLMLTDIVMPEMDGYDLAVEARKIAPHVRVVFMSSFARDPVRHPSGDEFLPKPFTSEALITIIDKALAF